MKNRLELSYSAPLQHRAFVLQVSWGGDCILVFFQVLCVWLCVEGFLHGAMLNNGVEMLPDVTGVGYCSCKTGVSLERQLVSGDCVRTSFHFKIGF